MLSMEQICEDWEIVSQKVDHPLLWSFFILIFGLIVPSTPRVHSDATWTVRQISTGIVKRVTANNKYDAADKITKGLFDPD